MSFMNLRKMSARLPPPQRQLTDLPESILKTIFSNCSLVDMTRCSLVNRQFRELIEDMEDEKSVSLRSGRKAKIFICDRRRAILEGVSTIEQTRLQRTPKNSESSDSGSSSVSSIASTSSASSEAESDSSSRTKTKRIQTSRQKELLKQKNRLRNNSDNSKSSGTSNDSAESKVPLFIGEQYSNMSDPNWAFAFDFDQWLQDYEINEVYFKNFCSFLEREKIDDPLLPSTYKGKTAYYESQILQERMPREERKEVRLTDVEEAEIRDQSAGRIERLVEKLRPIRGAHFIFKDSVCYGSRPPATIFYFLQLMRPNTRAITLDHVQAATKVELHEVLSMANLHRLTVIQPEKQPCVFVRAKLLTNWIQLPVQERKRISVHLVGCREFFPRDVLIFVEEWLRTDKPAIFKQIAIDGGSYKYNEFMDIMEALHNTVEKCPPRSPVNRSFGPEPNQHAVVLERTCRIAHPKDRSVIIQLKYCKPSRRMVLTIERDSVPAPVKALSPVSTLQRLTRPQSAAAVMSTPTRKISSTKPPIAAIPTYQKLNRPLSHDPVRMAGCRDNIGTNGSGMLNRLVSFLGTSS